ncbi:MAG TPA: hypothetical protein VM841_02795 [Actinomycetota bacterium]|nr:hypothetical protein [Actinomycetota bacterium]
MKLRYRGKDVTVTLYSGITVQPEVEICHTVGIPSKIHVAFDRRVASVADGAESS